MWGDRDVTIPPATHLDVQRAIPKVQYVSLPGQGHLPMVEAPETVHAPLIAFQRAH
jgi:pimeloyl-ACP methyl ester carboxylesterase